MPDNLLCICRGTYRALLDIVILFWFISYCFTCCQNGFFSLPLPCV